VHGVTHTAQASKHATHPICGTRPSLGEPIDVERVGTKHACRGVQLSVIECMRVACVSVMDNEQLGHAVDTRARVDVHA
jgi:hypothetical protein